MSKTDSLGKVIHQKRLSLKPSDVGLPQPMSHRRSLSMMEVAVLSGVSLSWLSRLERDHQTLTEFDGLQRVLQVLKFSETEQYHLLQLAGWRPESLSDLPKKEQYRELNQAINLIETPAYVLNHFWQPICHNSHAYQLFSHWLGKQSQFHNLLDYLLLDPHSRLFFDDWSNNIPILLQYFCQNINLYRESKEVQDFIQEKQQQSPLFTKHYQQYMKHPKNIQKPLHMRLNLMNQGVCDFHCVTFIIPNTPNWQMTLWLPEQKTAIPNK